MDFLSAIQWALNTVTLLYFTICVIMLLFVLISETAIAAISSILTPEHGFVDNIFDVHRYFTFLVVLLAARAFCMFLHP